MDRQTIAGFLLIFLLLMVWMWYNSPPPKPIVDESTQTQSADTARPIEKEKQPELRQEKAVDPYGKFFSSRVHGSERLIRIETDIYTAELSTRGATIRRWKLKKYKTWDGLPVQLVDYDKDGDLSLLFTTSDGRLVNTHDLYFDVDNSRDQVLNENNFEFKINFILPSTNGGSIVKTFTFRNDDYGFDCDISMVNLGSVISNYEYQLVWESGLRYTEHNSIDESGFAAAYSYAGKELTEMDAPSANETVQKDMTGIVDWVASRTKYFALAIIPQAPASEGAYIEGNHKPMPDNGAYESYTVAMKMPFKGASSENASFKLFIGPLEHSRLKAYDNGLESIMSLGWAWLIRPIAEYVFLPVMGGLHYFVPNWGIVIIIFSILIKIALHPLTKTSMKSMKKMQQLQPLMEEIRAKHKDDPQKMNKAIMNLYKEYGVNPAGGCLPILLQMPILYALYAVFRAHIDLRQAAFVWWITDLSVPDTIVSLPFHIPLFGMKDVSGIALLMGITMFVQQKMTVKDPRQKMMVWLMPVMLTLVFNSLPSGLNLYYAVFNILSIAQQYLINKQHDNEPLRKVEPKKRAPGGIFGKFPDEFRKLRKK
ncbi:MAG: membrane protein insertase YidC [Ignavibacteriales bacterium]|nr:membrane protein insertase YidC [Ignavibacteriales bacterium]